MQRGNGFIAESCRGIARGLEGRRAWAEAISGWAKCDKVGRSSSRDRRLVELSK